MLIQNINIRIQDIPIYGSKFLTDLLNKIQQYYLKATLIKRLSLPYLSITQIDYLISKLIDLAVLVAYKIRNDRTRNFLPNPN